MAKFLALLGVQNPVLLWALGPVIVFILFSLAFKAGAAAVHHKADVYFKYKAGDLRLALWERLNQRLGLCLGILNGTAYFILLCFFIYVPSYLTVQVASGEKDPKWMRLLNQMGHDLHSTGMAKVARALDSIPQVDYDMADFAGILYHNPLIEARLGSYPDFLALAERAEFAGLGADTRFRESWMGQVPVMELMEHPTLQGVRNNPELLKAIWNTVAPDLNDLYTYLASGNSPKWDPEKILGRWAFDANWTMSLMRRAKPRMLASEMQRYKQWMLVAFSKTRMVARTDNQVSLRDLPPLRIPAAGTSPGPQTFQGQWKSLSGGKYQLGFPNGEWPASVEGERMVIKADGTDLAFEREE
jgi:hypothetical protein